MIGRSIVRWALRMALMYALKKGIEMATRPPARTPPRGRSSSSALRASAIH